VDVHLPHRPPRISESCLSQPTWTITPKRTEQNLIARSGKSEAEVTNNRRLRSTYSTIVACYRQTRSIPRPLCDSWTPCFIFPYIRRPRYGPSASVRYVAAPCLCLDFTVVNVAEAAGARSSCAALLVLFIVLSIFSIYLHYVINAYSVSLFIMQ